MRYLSVCSGIEAATVAWHPLGWTPAAFSEIETFPRAVLAHHYPEVPLHGDFTTIGADEYGPVDLLVGGTPCQSFSVAGLRGGMADGRGNLALEYIRLARRKRARWVAWENVPGVFSSNGGDDFRCFLSGLVGWQVPIPEGGWQNSGIIAAGPGDGAYGVAWRVLDAQFAGVPQRRRRVFVVGYIGDWRRAAAVLFERHSLSGHPAPRREAREGSAGYSANGVGTCGADDNQGQAGHLLADNARRVFPTLDTRMDQKFGCNQWVDSGQFVMEPVAHSLRGEGFDASEDGTGRGTPLVPVPFDTTQITSASNYSNPKAGDPMHPLAAGAHPPCIAFSAKDHGADAQDNLSPTLRAGGHSGSHANAGVMPAVAFAQNSRDELREMPYVGALAAEPGMKQTSYIRQSSAVRRLTPRECERLQGFPDDYTLIPYRGKPAADGPRYKALGNSMAVPVMRWIGERIAAVEAVCARSLAA